MLKLSRPRYSADPSSFPALDFVVGLDTSGMDAHLIRSDAEERIPFPAEKLSFYTLNEFCSYWECNFPIPGETLIAVPKSGRDSMGICTWLEARGERLEKYSLIWPYHGLNCTDLGIEACYQRAYILALYLLHRYHASRVARDAYTMLSTIENHLRDLHRDMDILSMAFPEPDHLTLDDVPY